MEVDLSIYLYGFGMGIIATSIVMNVYIDSLLFAIQGGIFVLVGLGVSYFRRKA